ncbi:MAG: hypothetical protein V3W41_06330 [Planctomycetota bacterium]
MTRMIFALTFFLAPWAVAQSDGADGNSETTIEVKTADGSQYRIVKKGDRVISVNGQKVVRVKSSVRTERGKKPQRRSRHQGAGPGISFPSRPSKAPKTPKTLRLFGGQYPGPGSPPRAFAIETEKGHFGKRRGSKPGQHRILLRRGPEGGASQHSAIIEVIEDEEEDEEDEGDGRLKLRLRQGAGGKPFHFDVEQKDGHPGSALKLRRLGKQAFELLQPHLEQRLDGPLGSALRLRRKLAHPGGKGFKFDLKDLEDLGDLFDNEALEGLHEKLEHLQHLKLDLGDICSSLDGLNLDIRIHLDDDDDEDDDENQRSRRRPKKSQGFSWRSKSKAKKGRQAQGQRRSKGGECQQNAPKRRKDARQRQQDSRQHRSTLRKHQSELRKKQRELKRLGKRLRDQQERKRSSNRNKAKAKHRRDVLLSERATGIVEQGQRLPAKAKLRVIESLDRKRVALDTKAKQFELHVKQLNDADQKRLGDLHLLREKEMEEVQRALESEVMDLEAQMRELQETIERARQKKAGRSNIFKKARRI